MGNIEMDMFIIMHVPKGGSMIGWTHKKIIKNGKISKICNIEKTLIFLAINFFLKFIVIHCMTKYMGSSFYGIKKDGTCYEVAFLLT